MVLGFGDRRAGVAKSLPRTHDIGFRTVAHKETSLTTLGLLRGPGDLVSRL